MRCARSCPGLENRLLRQGGLLRAFFLSLCSKLYPRNPKNLFWGAIGYSFGSSFWVPRCSFGVPSGKLRFQPLFSFLWLSRVSCYLSVLTFTTFARSMCPCS